MGFDIKKIKSLFIVEDETAATPQAEQKTQDATTEQQTGSTGQLDQQILNTLLQSFADNNLQGFDYFEFKQSLRSLTAMNLGESIAFKSAFATAATLGITKSKLLETAAFYKSVLDKEKEKFNDAMLAQSNQAVHQKKDEVRNLQELIRTKSEEIKRLTTEITGHQMEMEKLGLVISQSEAKIKDTSANFERSFTYLKNEIDSDIQKIDQYI
jgi:hypothetical protein